MIDWVNTARVPSEAKNYSLAIEIITNAVIEEPDDPKPLAALAEIRAAQMDMPNLGIAVSQYVKLIEHKTGQKAEDIPSILFDDSDIRLRILSGSYKCGQPATVGTAIPSAD